MVRIRLSRTGAKKKPFYHVVATDQRSRRDGRYIERLGYFNPVARGKETELMLDVERIEYWESKGAQTSERVVSLVKHFKQSGGAEAIAEKAKAEEEARVAKREAEAAERAKAAEAADKEAAAKAKAEKEAKEAEAKAKADEEKAKTEADAKAEDADAPKAEADAGETADDAAAEDEKKDS